MSKEKAYLCKKEQNMSIIVNLDIVLAKAKVSSSELAQQVGITPSNLSILKTGKAKAVRFSTLEAICQALHCQPGDLLEYRGDDTDSPEEATNEQI